MLVAEREWISVREAARILGVTPQSAARVIRAAGNVRKKELPGMAPRMNRADVERLRDAAVSGGVPAQKTEAVQHQRGQRRTASAVV